MHQAATNSSDLMYLMLPLWLVVFGILIFRNFSIKNIFIYCTEKITDSLLSRLCMAIFLFYFLSTLIIAGAPDSGMVAVYFATILVIGLCYSRKIKTMRSFVVADNSCVTSVLIATIVATSIGGGSIIGFCDNVFDTGLLYIIGVGYAISILPLAYLFANKISKFKGMISIGDVMANFYGGNVKVITGVFGIIRGIGTIGSQMMAMGYILHSLLGMPYAIGIVLGAGILIAYSVFGGVRAVIATDAVQLVVLIMALYIILNFAGVAAGGYENIIASIPMMHLQLLPQDNFDFKYLSFLLVWWLPYSGPALVQRFLMAKNSVQLKVAASFASGIMAILIAAILMIGMIAVVLMPDFSGTAVLPALVNQVLPTGYKGFAVVGLLAVIMSTADSSLNAAAVNLVHDVIKPLRNKPFAEDFELKITKLATVVLGVFSIIVAVNCSNILELVFFSYLLWAPVITIPLFAGLLGFQTSSRSFLSATIAAMAMIVFWNIAGIEASTGLSVLLPGLLANAAGFFGSHYLMPRQEEIAERTT